MLALDGGSSATMSRARSLAGACLRANPALEFVAGTAVASIGWCDTATPGAAFTYAGVLRPRRDTWLGVRAVDAVTAEVFHGLHRPGAFPELVAERLGPDLDGDVARLVLDGVLEIERDGGFVSGADAHDVVFDGTTTEPSDGGVVASLSLAALRYGAALDIDDAERLAARLYFFNRLPVTPSWIRRLPNEAAMAVFLGVHRGSSRRATLERHWHNDESPKSSDGYSQWWPRARTEFDPAAAHVCKIFVSPDPQFAPEALHVLIDALVGFGAPFKFGAAVYGLLRPDKIVAYFSRLPDMTECASTLCRALAGMPAHGVPFSADMSGTGLISWGIDPPESIQPLAWRGPESWRLWVTSRLARSLILARHARAAVVSPIVFSLDRLALEGVNPVTWAPQEL